MALLLLLLLLLLLPLLLLLLLLLQLLHIADRRVWRKGPCHLHADALRLLPIS